MICGCGFEQKFAFCGFWGKNLGAEFWLFGEFKGADLRGILAFLIFGVNLERGFWGFCLLSATGHFA